MHIPLGEELFEVQHPEGLKLLDVRVGRMSWHHAQVVPLILVSLDILHQRLAHLSLDGMKAYIKQEGACDP